jgi:hypothetical protein
LLQQGTLTEGEGSVQLASSLRNEDLRKFSKLGMEGPPRKQVVNCFELFINHFNCDFVFLMTHNHLQKFDKLFDVYYLKKLFLKNSIRYVVLLHLAKK